MFTMHNPVRWVDPTGLFAQPTELLMDSDGGGSARQQTWQERLAELLREAAALARERRDSAPAPNINDIWDPVTINRIGYLHPAIRDSAIAFILDAQSQGIFLRITDGYRSIARQNELFAQGRTAPGSIVTNARGGQSYHNFGLAIDVVQMVQGDDGRWTPDWNGDWDRIGAIGMSHGFEWGGTWTSFVDRPHFQMTFDFTTAELLQRLNDGNTENGFVVLTR